MVRYYNHRESDQLNTFQFQPRPMSLEVIDRKAFTEVLYPKNIYDMIDYFVREFVKREQETFYAWSEKARESKARCDDGEISLQEFSAWLGNSQ